MILLDFEETGRLWLRGIITADDLSTLDALTDPGRPGTRMNGGTELRHVLGPNGSVGRALQDIWPGMHAVRIVAFSKDAGSNWSVPWHQDRVIAVRERADVPGYGNWSNKTGRWHCEPPRDVLESMLFVRLHLDAATDANGAMEIATGSHRLGAVAAHDAAARATEHPLEACIAERGDILVLKMLTLHRSPPSSDGRPRRALRVDFASRPLPTPLAWVDQ